MRGIGQACFRTKKEVGALILKAISPPQGNRVLLRPWWGNKADKPEFHEGIVKGGRLGWRCCQVGACIPVP